MTFKATATVCTYSSINGSITQEEKLKLYYIKQELNIFLLEAKAICYLSQGLTHIIPNSGTILDVALGSMTPLGSNNEKDEEDATESLCGLELLLYSKQKQNKLIAHRF